MGFINKDHFNNLKASIQTELVRRGLTSANPYTVTPDTGVKITTEHINEMVDDIQQINTGLLTTTDVELGDKLIESKITTIESQLSTLAKRDLGALASSDCSGSCTGACSTGCKSSCTSCTVGCTDGCTGTCGTSCSSGCQGACTSQCSGGCTGCSSCSGGCGGNCSGGCRGCNASCGGGFIS